MSILQNISKLKKMTETVISLRERHSFVAFLSIDSFPSLLTMLYKCLLSKQKMAAIYTNTIGQNSTIEAIIYYWTSYV